MRNIVRSKCVAVVVLVASLTILGCGDPDTSFTEGDPTGTDPYCNAIDDWEDEVTLTAAFSDSNKKEQIEVGFETSRDVVEMGGQVSAEGAEISLILYDRPDLWLVLLPIEEASLITLDGTIRCANREARFRLTLTDSADSDALETSISFVEGESDAGVPEADAGE